MPQQWIELGSGSFNIAYRNNEYTQVLKIPKYQSGPTDLPERSVRLWNEINSHLPAAYLASTQHGNGWICPYIEGRQSTDSEMAGALIDIYNKTGRIITDATAPKNFVTTASGKVVCIDIGMALQLQKKEETLVANTHKRTKSVVSLEAWADLQAAYTPFFRKTQHHYPKTVDTIKALLFIKSNRPDIFDASFLVTDSKIRLRLSHAYDAQESHFHSNTDIKTTLNMLEQASSTKKRPTPDEISEARKKLQNIRPVNLLSIKESCLVEIERYIRSRGTLKVDGKFDPSWITKIFRNIKLTTSKVENMKQLKNKINSADSYQEIKDHIDNLLQKNEATKSTFKSGLENSLARCLQIVYLGEQQGSQPQKSYFKSP